MRVEEDTLQTGNSGGPLRYRDVTDETARARGGHLLEILDKDKSNELSSYVLFYPVSTEDMRGRDYSSYENFLNDTWDGTHAVWAREKCAIVEFILR